MTVNDAALRKYYDTHRGMFRQQDLREIEYVTFEALPSQEDYAAAEKNVREMADGLRTTGNVRQFVSMNSHNPFDARYYKAGELTGELGAFAFGAGADEVYGPVLSGDQWTMARVADVQTMPDSVRLSSIVIPAEPKAFADSLLNALQRGADFAAAARAHSVEAQQVDGDGDLGMMDPQVLAPQFADVVKEMNVGDIRTVTTPEAICILKMTDRKGMARRVQLGVLNYNVEASEQTRNQVYGEANKFATAAAAGGFEKAVNDAALAKRVATIGSNDRTVGGIQQSRELARWAFNGEQGELSDVKEFGNYFVVATITGVREKGIAPFEQVKEDLKTLVVREKKGEMLAAKMKGAASVAALASTLGVDTLHNDDINFGGFMAPEVGFDPAFTGGVSGIGKTGGNLSSVGSESMRLRSPISGKRLRWMWRWKRLVWRRKRSRVRLWRLTKRSSTCATFRIRATGFINRCEFVPARFYEVRRLSLFTDCIAYMSALRSIDRVRPFLQIYASSNEIQCHSFVCPNPARDDSRDRDRSVGRSVRFLRSGDRLGETFWRNFHAPAEIYRHSARDGLAD